MPNLLRHPASGAFSVVPDPGPEPRAALRPAEDLGARAAIATRLFGEHATPVMIGRFRILRRLGEGGMGRVYEAEDAELDRRIAVKLLTDPGTEGGVARERMLREARSLARLSHPNVVQIFDVGEHAGAIFLAMEFVDGASLADWQASTHGWRAVLDKYLQAGEGLAAVHQTGLVHRDFKPANVLLDAKGRVKVADFGVALFEASAATTTASARIDCDPTESGTMRLTATGAMLGTPVYMSPEQLRGRGVDTRSDQFSFCFALYEAVFGALPYSIEQRRDRDLRLELGNRRAPGWLRAVLLRGLAARPSDRWPDMETLLRALRRGASRPRMLAIVAGVALGATTVASAAAWIARPSCDDARGAIERVWNDGRADGVRTAFAQTGLSFAPTTAETIVSRMDAIADEWGTTRVAVCQEHRLQRSRSAEFHDASMACLDRRLTDLGSVAARLEHIDAAGVAVASGLLGTLTPIESCTDLEWLQSSTLYRESPDAAELRELVVEARLEHALGRFDDALAAAEAVSERARAIGADRVRADATALRAHALVSLGRWVDAEAAYLEAMRLAEATHHDELAVEVWRELVEVAVKREQLDAAERWLTLLDGAVLRIGDPPAARAEQLVGASMVSLLRNDLPATERALREALTRFAEAGMSEEPPGLEALRRLANVLADQRQRGAADELYRRAAEITRARWGEGHPDLQPLAVNQALLAQDVQDWSGALPHLERALALGERVYGPESEHLVGTLVLYAKSLAELALFERAYEYATRARELSRRIPAWHSESANALRILAYIEIKRGRDHSAIALLEEARALTIRDPLAVAQTERSLAILYCDVAECEGAAEALERAIAAAPEHATDLQAQLAEVRARIERTRAQR